MSDTAPATFTVLDVSTAHVTTLDMEGIRYVESVHAYPDEYGAWVLVDSDPEAFEEGLAQMSEDGMSELFIAVLRRAADAGCRYVRLDGDAPIDPALATSDTWN